MPTAPSKTATDAIGNQRKDEIESLCTRVFGTVPDRVAFPGGKHRSTFIANIGGQNYAIAKRADEKSASIEGIVMKSLSKTGLVPKMIAVNGMWIVQECLDGLRLPILLDQSENAIDREVLMDNAIAAMALLHEVANEDRLQYRVGNLGIDHDWSFGHTDRPARISKALGIQPPVLDLAPLEKCFSNDHRDFIKGDARPGNALVNGRGVVWIDWDGCGTRNALDDLVFILADEWTTLDFAAEARLIDKHIHRFYRGRSPNEAYRYVMAYGVFHMCARMRRAIRYRQRDGRWWSREKCLLGDKIGITKSEVGRLCLRVADWASEIDELKPLVPWSQAVMERLKIEPGHVVAHNSRAKRVPMAAAG